MSAIYRSMIAAADRFVPHSLVPLWNSPAGPKTIFFWAPTFKWALVIAGIGDIARPPEKLSLYQSSALAATGCIWARYSLVIIPKNYNLFMVNIFVGLTGIFQLSRIFTYRKSLREGQPALPAPETTPAAEGKSP
ncbi:mitochondrial pyruvate carrier 2-like [Haliotis rufescens]|uniref:mitochondrial pyruvate carrier 2-like n=1 Tax=Haliotis rufescens TaxID=6454 RepID=UPI001EB0A131|nr:mitochondrial pyruvate carrier 2-like [Haliotis rufescens]